MITQQPEHSVVPVAGSGYVAAFSVAAEGDGALTYQWRRRQYQPGAFVDLIEGQDGGRVTGVNTPTLTIVDVECGDAGEFDCVVTDSCGAFPSNVAQLIIEDVTLVTDCMFGPDVPVEPACELADFDMDLDVDLQDFATVQLQFGQACP